MIFLPSVFTHEENPMGTFIHHNNEFEGSGGRDCAGPVGSGAVSRSQISLVRRGAMLRRQRSNVLIDLVLGKQRSNV